MNQKNRPKWNKLFQEKRKYLVYTVCFLLFAVPLLYADCSQGEMLTTTSDNRTQYFTAMYYIGQWIREYFSGLLKWSFVPRLIDLRLGMGDDVIATLNYYGFGNPLYLLAAFFDLHQLPYFFNTFFYLQLYVAGIAYILFCEVLTENKVTTAGYVTGAFAYILSGFALTCNWFINFGHAMIYIPLMLAAVHIIYEGGRKRWLTYVVFLFALSGFFFLYIGTIAAAVYLLVRIFSGERKQIKENGRKLLRIVGSYLTGLGLSAFIFVPEIAGFFQSNRSGTVKPTLLYTFSQYKQMFFGMLLYAKGNQVLVLPLISILAIAVIALSEKKGRAKLYILGGLAAAGLPVVSWIMSGMGGIYDRWEIVLILLAAYYVTVEWQNLLRPDRFQRLGIFNFYIILALLGRYYGYKDERNYQLIMLAFTIYVICFIIIRPVLDKFDGKLRLKLVWELLLMIIAVVSMVSWWKENKITNSVDATVEAQNPFREVQAKDQSIYRVENERTFGTDRLAPNISLLLNYNSTAEYFSIENSYYCNALKQLQITPTAGYDSFTNYGLDRRTILETMSSVKYMALYTGNEYLAPYGFILSGTSEDGTWKIFENRYALPLLYLYDQTIDYTSYEELDGVAKQRAMLQGAALKNYDGAVTKAELQLPLYETYGYELTDTGQAAVNGSQLQTDTGTEIVITVPMKAQCENYMICSAAAGIDSISFQGKDITVWKQADSVINIGYAEKDTQIEIRVRLGENTSMNQDDIVLATLNMIDYEQYISKIREKTVNDIRMDNNRITAQVHTEADEILCMAIPYRDGWHAAIDGRRTAIYEANDLYMAIEVPEGEHDIMFYYVTPGLRLGVLISVITLGFCIYMRKKDKKR